MDCISDDASEHLKMKKAYRLVAGLKRITATPDGMAWYPPEQKSHRGEDRWKAEEIVSNSHDLTLATSVIASHQSRHCEIRSTSIAESP